MAHAQPQGRRIARLAILPVVAVSPYFLPALAQADRIVLRGGGSVKGKVIPGDSSQKGLVVVLGERGRTPLTFKKDQVVQIIPEKGPLDEYLERKNRLQPTAAAEYELGVWCEKQKLLDLANIHFEQAVKYDDAHAEAHQKLGHVQYGAKWLTVDQVREAQGLVKHKGKWISKEEKERLDESATLSAEQSGWSRRLKTLRNAVVNGPEPRAREAEAQLLAIKEKVAVKPVLRTLGTDPNPEIRALAAQILSGIPGREASSALVNRMLNEPDETVRQPTMNALAKREDPVVVSELTNALTSKNTYVINRAAWALGNLGAKASVPKLVPALVTVEYETVLVQPTVNPNGGVGGGTGFPGTQFGMMNGYGPSVPVVGAPAVGPGVVAFGASSVPFSTYIGQTPIAGNAATDIPGRGPVPKMVASPRKNTEVLQALIKLTGKDFGYEVATWKRYVETQFRVDPVPVRRVPQP